MLIVSWIWVVSSVVARGLWPRARDLAFCSFILIIVDKMSSMLIIGDKMSFSKLFYPQNTREALPDFSKTPTTLT